LALNTTSVTFINIFQTSRFDIVIWSVKIVSIWNSSQNHG